VSSPARGAAGTWSGTQERILRAARALLEEHGAAAVRLEDVGKRAGVSRQAVYLHFGSRAGLLVELVHWIDHEGRFPERAARVVRETGGALATLDAYLDLWTTYVPRIQPVAHALLAERATDEAADAAWRDRMDALHGALERLVEALEREGLLAEPWTRREAADWLWALVSVQVFDALAERGWSRRRWADRLRRVVHAALVSGAAR
jgi:AcrR family transcriptional regulator